MRVTRLFCAACRFSFSCLYVERLGGAASVMLRRALRACMVLSAGASSGRVCARA